MLEAKGLGMSEPDDFSPHLLFNGPPFPVGEVCPQCGRRPDRMMLARPWIWAGLRKDYACSRCMLGFTPPRPLWARVFYLGSLLACSGVVLTIIATVVLPDWHPDWVDTVCPPLAYLAGLVLFLMMHMRE